MSDKKRSVRSVAAAKRHLEPELTETSRSKRSRMQVVNYKEYDDQEIDSINSKDEEDYEDDDEILGLDKEILGGDDGFDNYSSSTPDLTRMTERQRRKYLEENIESDDSNLVSEFPTSVNDTQKFSTGRVGGGFVALSNDIKKKNVLTE